MQNLCEKENIITCAVSNIRWRIQLKLNDRMCCLLTPSKVAASINGHIIYMFQV